MVISYELTDYGRTLVAPAPRRFGALMARQVAAFPRDLKHNTRGLGRGLMGRAPPGAGGSSSAGSLGNPMLPHATVTSKGQNNAVTNPTPYNSAPDPDLITGNNGPLTVQETGQLFLRVTRPVRLVDLVASTSAGAALSDFHALSIFVGNIGNRAVTVYSSTVVPTSAQRHVPALVIQAGVDVYFQAYQLQAVAAEQNTWNLAFA